MPWGRGEREYGKYFERVTVVLDDEETVSADAHITRQVKEHKMGSCQA